MSDFSRATSGSVFLEYGACLRLALAGASGYIHGNGVMMDCQTKIGTLASSMPDLAEHIQWFDGYAASWMAEPCPSLELKALHTVKVTELAHAIARAQSLSGNEMRSAVLAALFHDVGRFPQFYEWKTFRDADSVNHGLLGARVLVSEKVLAEEDREVRKRVIPAVALHNCYALPTRLRDDVRLITDIVRDADKVDILRIFSEELTRDEPSEEVLLHVARQPDKWSPHIVKKILDDETPKYSELKDANDFIMLLCSWPANLNFAASRELLKNSSFIETLLGCLPRKPELDEVRAVLMQRIEEKNA